LPSTRSSFSVPSCCSSSNARQAAGSTLRNPRHWPNTTMEESEDTGEKANRSPGMACGEYNCIYYHTPSYRSLILAWDPHTDVTAESRQYDPLSYSRFLGLWLPYYLLAVAPSISEDALFQWPVSSRIKLLVGAFRRLRGEYIYGLDQISKANCLTSKAFSPLRGWSPPFKPRTPRIDVENGSESCSLREEPTNLNSVDISREPQLDPGAPNSTTDPIPPPRADTCPFKYCGSD
jgi:hypothetical protein